MPRPDHRHGTSRHCRQTSHGDPFHRYQSRRSCRTRDFSFSPFDLVKLIPCAVNLPADHPDCGLAFTQLLTLCSIPTSLPAEVIQTGILVLLSFKFQLNFAVGCICARIADFEFTCTELFIDVLLQFGKYFASSRFAAQLVLAGALDGLCYTVQCDGEAVFIDHIHHGFLLCNLTCIKCKGFSVLLSPSVLMPKAVSIFSLAESIHTPLLSSG